MSAVIQPAVEQSSNSIEHMLRSERVGTMRHLGRWIDFTVMGAAVLAAIAFWPEGSPNVIIAWLSCAAAH